MVIIIFSFLFAVLFGFISLVFFINSLGAFSKYIAAKTIWLKNIGSQYRHNLNIAKCDLVYNVILFICLALETLMFVLSFILSIYLRFNF